MPNGYKRQHLRIDHFVDPKPYKRPTGWSPGAIWGGKLSDTPKA